jgi:hypothetical protein
VTEALAEGPPLPVPLVLVALPLLPVEVPAVPVAVASPGVTLPVEPIVAPGLDVLPAVLPAEPPSPVAPGVPDAPDRPIPSGPDVLPPRVPALPAPMLLVAPDELGVALPVACALAERLMQGVVALAEVPEPIVEAVPEPEPEPEPIVVEPGPGDIASPVVEPEPCASATVPAAPSAMAVKATETFLPIAFIGGPERSRWMTCRWSGRPCACA